MTTGECEMRSCFLRFHRREHLQGSGVLQHGNQFSTLMQTLRVASSTNALPGDEHSRHGPIARDLLEVVLNCIAFACI